MTAIGRATGPRIGSSSSLAADSSGFGGRVDIGIVCAEQTCCIPWPLSPKSPFLLPSTTASPATSSSISVLMVANSSTRQASSSPSPLFFFFLVSSSSHYTRKHVAVAAAQILFQRFWYVSSMKHFGVAVGPCLLSPLCLVHSSPGYQHGCPLPRVQASRNSLAHA